MKLRFHLILSVLSLAIATSVFAAGAQQTAQAESRTVLRVGVENFTSRLDPGTVYSNATAQFFDSIAETLVRITPHEQPYRVLPGLAESWNQISSTIMEYRLREGAKFWDGSPVEATDVAWSLNRIINREHSRYSSAWGRVFYNFEKVEIVDGRTVRVHTIKPDPLVHVLLAQTPAAIVSKDQFDATADVNDFFRLPIGAGPYEVTDFKENQLIELTRFEDYWGEKPALQKIIFYQVPEVSSRVTALVNDEVDMIVSIPPDQVSALAGRNGIKTYGVRWDMFHVYVLNAARTEISDVRIRRALHLAIDREALVNAFWDGKGVAPTSHHYVDRTGYDPNWTVFEYDPDEARRLLRDAGYDGTPIELDFGASYYLYGDQVAPAIAQMWEDVGFTVRLSYVESWLPRTVPEQANMTRGWSNPMYFPDLLGGMDPHWAPSSWPVTDGMAPLIGEGGALRDRYLALYDAARYGTDPAARTRAYRELVEMLEFEVVPWLILFQPYEYFAMKDDIDWEVPKNYRPFTYTFRAGDIDLR